MNSIRIDELKVGQIFSQPVYIEDDVVLVPAGVAIRGKDLERLHTWKVRSVETEGVLQNAAEMPHDWGFPVADESFNLYTKGIHKIDEVFTRIRDAERVSKNEIEETVLFITDAVEADQKEAIRLVLAGITSRKVYAKDALDTGILSLIIGLRLGNTKSELFQLCCAALLHDIGMQRIPFDLAKLNRTLGARERKALKAHPIHSYKIVREELQLPNEIAQTVLQHHERWDGEGYPRGLKGDDILLNSRIIAVADAFVALISERLWRKSMIGYEAMRVVLGDNQRKFDPEIVKLIIGILGIYPIGSLVQLSDGSIGRVCGVNEDTPLRPEVLILIDKLGAEFRDGGGPTINLHNEGDLFIARVVSSSSLSAKSMAECEE